jgi:hypothetical protein
LLEKPKISDTLKFCLKSMRARFVHGDEILTRDGAAR